MINFTHNGYSAFIERHGDSAMVEIREQSSATSLGRVVAYYETASKGAAASARRHIDNLKREG